MKVVFFWSSAVVLAFVGNMGHTVHGKPTLSPGTQIKYRLQQESVLRITIKNREQEEKLSATFDFSAQVGQKNDQSLTPVKLQVNRLQALVKSFVRKPVAFDSDNQDAAKPLPTYQLVPFLAFKQLPIHLMFDQEGRLRAIDDADKLQGRVEELLKKDFGGSEEYQCSSAIFAGNFEESALRTRWKDILVIEMPKNQKVGESWETPMEIAVNGCLPSESWLAPMKVSLKCKYTAISGDDGALIISKQGTVHPSESRATKLGPCECTYEVRNGTGKGKAEVAADGWVRTSEATLEIHITGTFTLNGDSIPMQMSFNTSFSLQRVPK